MSQTSPTLSGNEELAALTKLITSSVDAILKSCGSRTFPSSDELFTLESEAARMDPDVQVQSGIAIAAATQLIAALRPPPLAICIHCDSFLVPASIRAAVELHVPEIIRSAGSQGAHVKDIASPTNADPGKLGRVLRLLASNHIFKEVAPDTFVHNRISSLMDTGKNVEDILADPQSKHDRTLGIAAAIEHVCDEGYKSAGYLPETLKDPKMATSGEPNVAAFNTAYNTDIPVFEWFELAENQYRRRRFATAMEGTQNLTPPGTTINGFDWLSLPKNAIVVDVGGGFGAQSLVLAKAFDHLKFIVQDKKFVIQDAPKFWDAQYPEAVKAGRVEFQVHDFFETQPVHAPAVFFLRMILHDWSDEYCLKILRRLRDASGPETQIVIIDGVVSAVCEESESVKSIPGGTLPPAPSPLLANYGSAGIFGYLSDVFMLTMFNGSERTVASYKSLFERSGWKLTRIESYGIAKAIGETKIIGVPA